MEPIIDLINKEIDEIEFIEEYCYLKDKNGNPQRIELTDYQKKFINFLKENNIRTFFTNVRNY